MVQRRKHNRVEVHFPVCCRFMDSEGKPFAFIGVVQDLSISGMRVSLTLPPTLEHPKNVQYDLPLPQPFSPIHGQGDVRWIRWDNESHKTILGLEFSALKDVEQADIQAIVNELEADRWEYVALQAN